MRRFAASLARMAGHRLARTGPRTVMALGVASGIGAGIQYKDMRGLLPHDGTYGTRPDTIVTTGVIHHTATNGQSLRTIAAFHVEVNKWPGIAYHYAIGWDGIVYQLHDLSTRTYHAAGHNRYTVGIALVGNYQEREPTEAQMYALIRLAGYLEREHGIQSWVLHRDLKPTLCPGDSAAPIIRTILQ